MSTISDDQMMAMLSRSRLYTVALLQAGPSYEPAATRSAQVKALIWEHGRRNFGLRASGKLALVGPGTDDGPFLGLYVFNADEAEAREILAEDPAIAAGIFVVQYGQWRSFPGDALPE